MHYSASILGGVRWVDQPPEAPNTQGVVLVGGVECVINNGSGAGQRAKEP